MVIAVSLRVTYANMFCEMVLEHQNVGDSTWSVQLHGNLYAGKIYVQDVQWSGGHFGCIALMLQAMHTGLDGLLHLINHSWQPEMLL